MLTVDSNKRIKLHEIRQLPWFQKELAPYLFAPATTMQPSLSSSGDGADSGAADNVGHESDLKKSSFSRGGDHMHLEHAPGSESEQSQDSPHHEREQYSDRNAEQASRELAEADEGDARIGGDEALGAEPKRRREWVDQLGVVDQEIVDDLCGKIAGLKSDDVWAKLKEGHDRELRIAYQLCRDNKRMVEGCR